MFRCVLSALVALLLLPSLAAAADLKEVVDQLGAGDFGGKIEAVEDIGGLGDGRAVAVLRSLNDGALYVTADHRVVLAQPEGDHFKTFDPLDGTPLGEAAADALDKVLVNNRLRGAIDAALGSLTLVGGRPQDRLSAAQEALKHPAADGGAALEKALAAEKDPQVRAAFALALAAARIGSGSRVQRLPPAAALAQSSDPQVRSVLTQQRDPAHLDPDLRRPLHPPLLPAA